jgi:hypothetical protein
MPRYLTILNVKRRWNGAEELLFEVPIMVLGTKGHMTDDVVPTIPKEKKRTSFPRNVS